MSTSAQDGPLPDGVPAADYIEQQVPADPDTELVDDEVSVSPATTSRVEAEQLDADVEADEADLLEQATSVPSHDDEVDETE